jgi:hypothetical protein
MNATDDPQMCSTEALNALLRGEMSAVETYTQAMRKFDDDVVIADLQKIRDEHSRAVRELRDHVIRCGGRPTEGSEPWEAFASTAAGAAKVVAPATALAALRLGEEQGALEYEAALENPEVPPDTQRTIRLDLLAACHRHIEELNRLLGGMNR